MISEDDDPASPAPTPIALVRVLAMLAVDPVPDVPEHDSPLEPRACGCGGWCELRKP